MSNYDDSSVDRSGYGGESRGYGGESKGYGGESGGYGGESGGYGGNTGSRTGDDSYGSSDRSDSSAYGSGITGGAGSGNKYTSGAQESTGLGSDYGSGHRGETTDRNEPYSGHMEYGSGATGGAGFGNKSSSGSADDSSYGGNPDTGRNSDPYTGQNQYGSGTTGGAGFGNKSSRHDGDDSTKGDSTSGKIMEKMGGMFGNEKMKEQGREKREGAGYGDETGSGGYERANADIAALLRRFENIIEHKPGNRNAVAVDAYKMEVETAALIRAAEDILSLTRVMKEMWLFGKLQTVGISEAEDRVEESARGVEEGLRRLMGGVAMVEKES